MITSDNLVSLMPDIENVDAWTAALNKTSTQYDIEAGNRLSMFMAQTMYESGNYTVLTENLNYSAAGLMAIFGEYFPNINIANQYARLPQKIASRVYANRMGNGDEASGDGWNFRGRGLIQITGKSSYESFANAVGMSLGDVVNYLETPEGAAMSAGWFWNVRDLNNLADADEFTTITEKINGGLNGLTERKAMWSKVQTILV